MGRDPGYPGVSQSSLLPLYREAIELHTGSVRLPPNSSLCSIIAFLSHSTRSKLVSVVDTALNLRINH
jgi:hypothetical protein